MRSVVAAAVVLLVACAPRLDVGAACALASECPDPLVCLLGRCRSECETYRDCEDGEMCLLDQASGNRACRTDAERTCDLPCGDLECVEDRCVQTCETTDDCGGTVCTALSDARRVCVEPTGGACTDGSTCAFGVCRDGYCDPVRSLGAGTHNTCVLLESGRIACAGGNTGMLLNGTEPAVMAFTPVVDALGGQPPFESMDLGDGHACALAGGLVRCWGLGGRGQNAAMGNVRPIPEAVATVSGVREVATSVAVSCLRTESDVYCFGSDQFGQIGDLEIHPTEFPSVARPVRVEFPTEAARPVDIDTGGYHACAVVEDGSVYCWGGNDFDQISPWMYDVCSLSGRTYDCTQTPIRLAGFGPGERVAVEVALGQSHTCLRTMEGGVFCQGANQAAQLGNGAPSPIGELFQVFATGVVEIASGQYFTCARFDDNRVACWGDNARRQLGTDGGGGGAPAFAVIPGGARDLELGWSHACALSLSGDVYCWGDANEGRLGEDPAAPVMRDPVPVPTRVRMGPMGF